MIKALGIKHMKHGFSLLSVFVWYGFWIEFGVRVCKRIPFLFLAFCVVWHVSGVNGIILDIIIWIRNAVWALLKLPNHSKCVCVCECVCAFFHFGQKRFCYKLYSIYCIGFCFFFFSGIRHFICVSFIL